MMGIFDVVSLSGTTDSSGDATVTGDLVKAGVVYGIYADVDALAAGGDTTVSYTMPDGDSVTLLTLTDTNTSGMVYVRETEQDNVGADATSTVAPLIDGVPKVVVAQGGDTKAFDVRLYVMNR